MRSNMSLFQKFALFMVVVVFSHVSEPSSVQALDGSEDLLEPDVVIGILPATAIPAFVDYMERAQTSEASENLGALSTGSASEYLEEYLNRREIMDLCGPDPYAIVDEILNVLEMEIIFEANVRDEDDTSTEYTPHT